jgi:DNA polymerase-3 subunit alpha
MQHSDFVPLHLHTEYSLLDGAIKIPELVAAAEEFRMPAVAVTDHGNMFGAVEFYKKATSRGVKPILGCEVYVAPGSRFERSRKEADERAFHLVVLARDMNGYRNLVALISRAYTEGFYYKPRIDRDLLEQYSGGLICLSACMQGEVPYHLRRGDIDSAREAALAYKHILGPENFYLELQENGMKEQPEINRRLYELGRELHIGLVATNDCHYLRREDARAHEILLCIQTGKTMSDPTRMKFEGDGFYFRSPEEMKEAFRDLPEAVLNTREIAERCNVEFRFGKNLLPRFTPPDGSRPSAFIETLARRALRERMGGEPPAEYAERLNSELSIIKNMVYSSYFLIVWDFIEYSKAHDIPVGPGRGSAAGSLVAYALGITEIDPMKYGLLFERFLNPDRISMPDIDVDFCKDKRPEVISYVSEKYGKDHVAQIITFGTMAARAAIRDVARAMDFPYAEADRLAKMVPETLKITIKDSIRLEPQLKEVYAEDRKVRDLLDIAMRLEGLARHASTHAAGVVIAPEPITDYVPLYGQPSEEINTTQFDMGSIESLGLIKFDFLGLKTLTVVEKTLEYIREGGGELTLRDIPLEDKRTYDFLGTGATTGVFQLESEGMKDILRKMSPSRFEDLIALVALYRPGPIKSGMIEDFIKRKKGRKAVKYELPQLKDVLDETYGVIVYQEQVMQIANKLANFSMGQADVLRKAMGKKDTAVMDKQKEVFIEGAVGNGISEKKAERLFDLMAFFAEYGFNKSHSAAYAYIAYQTAYLKAHYPVHFMAATLSVDLDNSEKIVKSIKECRNMGINILPPDINLCRKQFRVSEKGMRFGLGAVKGVGAAAIESIITAREANGAYNSIEDFLRRVDTRKVNRKVLEALVNAGAFDSLGEPHDVDEPRMRFLGRLRAKAMRMVSSASGDVPSLDLFGDTPEAEEAWEELELLRNEKAALGFYITGNPLMKYRRELAALNIRGILDLANAEDKQEVQAAGLIADLRKLRTKKGDIMAAMAVEDGEGSVEVIVFPELYKSNAAIITKDTPVLVKGELEKTEKGMKIVAKEFCGLEGFLEKTGNGRKVVISINGRDPDLKALRGLFEGKRGDVPLYLKIRTGTLETTIATSLSIRPDRYLLEKVEEYFGKGTFKVV